MRFWIPWTVDAIIAFVVLYFFFLGLADGSVSSFNGVLWAGILASLAVVVGGGLWLKSIKRSGLATALVLLLAVPGILFVLFFLVVILSGARWN